MGFLAKATDYRIGKYRGGKKDIAVSTATAAGNNYTAMHSFAPGLEINPAEGENLVIQRMRGSSSFMVTVGGTNQNIAPSTAKGERRLYSVSEDGSEIKAIAKFKNDGTLELNGATDSAVKYAALETAYNELQTQYNKLIGVLNTWVPVPGDGGTALKTAITGAAPLNSSGDITASESADVKLS